MLFMYRECFYSKQLSIYKFTIIIHIYISIKIVKKHKPTMLMKMKWCSRIKNIEKKGKGKKENWYW